MHPRHSFDPRPRSRKSRAGSGGPRPRAPRSLERAPSQSALDRLRRAYRHRARALRELGLDVPAAVLERHPRDLAWRVSVMDRWIGRHLDLVGGRRLPPWEDADVDVEDDADGDGIIDLGGGS